MDLKQKANELGFVSKIKLVHENLKSPDIGDLDKLLYYLWLCELQKWLREVYIINVYCIPCQHDENLWYNNIASHNPVFTGKYEEALELGLYQALLLINL